MSLIVAIKKDGVVYLGADTRATRASTSELSYPQQRMTRLTKRVTTT